MLCIESEAEYFQYLLMHNSVPSQLITGDWVTRNFSWLHRYMYDIYSLAPSYKNIVYNSIHQLKDDKANWPIDSQFTMAFKAKGFGDQFHCLKWVIIRRLLLNSDI